MADNKKRHVVSYEKMPLNPALAAAFAEKYPRGFADYLTDLVKYPKPDGTFFYAVTVEIPDAIYLVKIKLKTDDAEALERWLEGEEDAENVAHWVALTDCANEGVYCSHCHKKVYKSDYSNTMKVCSKFCPNCGFKMLPKVEEL